MIQPVVLCGGKGSRLWPLSRELYPKQFLTFSGENTLFQRTLERIGDIPEIGEPLILCNTAHRFFVVEQLRSHNIQGQIVLEPEGKNTAPAIAVSALMQQDDPLLLVMPADHVLSSEAFAKAVVAAIPLAEQGLLVTFGVCPERPETGYGYIEVGDSVGEGYRVARFVEKPAEDVAQSYMESGKHYWNSGIFLFKASAFLAELNKFAPEIYAGCKEAVEHLQTDLDFIRLAPELFAKIPEQSIDYAVMEHSDNSAVVPLHESGWNDLGSWKALYDEEEKDEAGNVVKGDILIEDSRDCYIHAESRLVGAVGLQRMIVVETPDAFLVADKDRAQDVKAVVRKLNDAGRPEAQSHSKVYRPWGSYQSIACAGRFQVKRIVVNPGQTLSLQKHHHRAEHWVVVSGTAIITNGENELLLTEDQSTYIPLGQVHRLRNPGCIPLEIVEVQTGSYLGEDDIVRLEDVYGRSGEA